MSKQELSVLFVPKGALGHINPSLNLGRLLKSRGHEVVFATERSWTGFFAKEGFKEEIYDDEPFDPSNPRKPGEFWCEFMKDGSQTWFAENSSPESKAIPLKAFIERIMYSNQRVGEIALAVKPQIIIQDHYVCYPSLVASGIPVVPLFSANPLAILASKDLPPPKSGLPLNDDSQWEDFNTRNGAGPVEVWAQWKKVVAEHSGHSLPHMRFQFLSRYLNIMVYPGPAFEDYARVAKLGPEWMRIDHCVKPAKEEFVLPNSLADKPGKWVFVSMGSMASSVESVNKRIINILGKSKNKFIFVRGYSSNEVSFPENMWAVDFLPQVAVLPKVDLVITHGGNNTFAEVLFFGKPMIVISLFADQHDNAQRAVEMGVGKRLNIWKLEEQELLDAIDGLLNDEGVSVRVQNISKALQHSRSLEEVADRVEHVAKNAIEPFYFEETMES